MSRIKLLQAVTRMDNSRFEVHPSLYFVDGNIALCAPDSPGKYVVFRVHRSILSKVSHVFKDMFTLPDGETGETYDGVPLVYMTDCASELENLLKILYHETTLLPFSQLDPRTPTSVRKVLLLANKYGMDQFRLRIIKHIEQDWPQSLWHWDMLEAQIAWMQAMWHRKPDDEPDSKRLYLDDNLPEPASVIRLARDCDIPTVLPAAFYHLSRLSICDDWCETRQYLDADPMNWDVLDNGRRTAEWHLLAAEDFISLLKGRSKLSVAAGEMLRFGYLSQDSEEHFSVTCSELKRFQLFQEIREACQRSTDILCVTRKYMDGGLLGDEICHSCRSSIKKDLDTFRQRLWIQLPDFFGLK